MTNATNATNVHWHATHVSRDDRETARGHRGATIWFTGLSGSGKSTLANAVDRLLHERGVASFVLDGDNIRHGLNSDLGFSPEDRSENIRRIGEVAKLFTEAGMVVLTAFISPYRRDRESVRRLLGRRGDFIEVFVSCPLAVCEERDPKGLYARARAGEIPEFTGISAPYEAPESAELVLETDVLTVDEAAARVVAFLEESGYFADR